LQLQSQAPPPSGQEHWHEQGMFSPVGGMGGIPDPDPDPDPVIGSGVAPDPVGPDPGSDPDPVGTSVAAPPSWQLDTAHFPFLHDISIS